MLARSYSVKIDTIPLRDLFHVYVTVAEVWVVWDPISGLFVPKSALLPH